MAAYAPSCGFDASVRFLISAVCLLGASSLNTSSTLSRCTCTRVQLLKVTPTQSRFPPCPHHSSHVNHVLVAHVIPRGCLPASLAPILQAMSFLYRGWTAGCMEPNAGLLLPPFGAVVVDGLSTGQLHHAVVYPSRAACYTRVGLAVALRVRQTYSSWTAAE